MFDVMATATGLIMGFSWHTGMSCPDVFSQAAVLVNPSLVRPDQAGLLEQTAGAACAGGDPDAVWALALTESSFRFHILRFNETRTAPARVLTRSGPVRLALQGLAGRGATANADLGLLQINYYWHRSTFSRDPRVVADPVMQVRYLTEVLKPRLERLCGLNWIGCYHRPRRGPVALAYEGRYTANRRVLATLLRNMATHPARRPLLSGRPDEDGWYRAADYVSALQRGRVNPVRWLQRLPPQGPTPARSCLSCHGRSSLGSVAEERG